MSEVRLSFCAVVKDSLKNIQQMIESIQPIVDEIIIVDTGSSEEVLSYENSVADKVIQTELNGNFALARNRSLEESSGDWILTLDSDETLSPGLLQKIPELIKSAPIDVDGFNFGEVHYVDEASPFPDYWKHLRLYRSKARYSGSVHESIKNLGIRLTIEDENCFVLHHNSRSHQYEKAMIYTANLKRKLAEVESQGNKPMIEYYTYK
ncbi:MAG: glycosyltransferase, partial [bacterium]